MSSAAQSTPGPGVLVTRPRHQADNMISSLRQAGFTPLPFPSIEIAAPHDITPARQRIADLARYHLVIFISTNAVDRGLSLIDEAAQSIEQPVAAIGKSTAKRLQQQGIQVDLLPGSEYTSEALLQLPALQKDAISAKHVLIFRGQSGREQLAQTLRKRGADVDYAEVYQRRRPDTGALDLHTLWQQDAIQLVTVTSNEALENLYHMLDTNDKARLLNTVLVVPGQRCAQQAQHMGFSNQILIADNATDEAMLECIKRWHNR